jgi:hypothetical protein
LCHLHAAGAVLGVDGETALKGKGRFGMVTGGQCRPTQQEIKVGLAPAVVFQRRQQYPGFLGALLA